MNRDQIFKVFKLTDEEKRLVSDLSDLEAHARRLAEVQRDAFLSYLKEYSTEVKTVIGKRFQR